MKAYREWARHDQQETIQELDKTLFCELLVTLRLNPDSVGSYFPVMTRLGDTRRQFLRRIGTAGTISVLGHPRSLLTALAGEADQKQPASVGSINVGSPGGIVRIRPLEYVGAFANPLKGFRPDIPSDGGRGAGLDNPLVTLARHYIRWNQIEDSAADGVDKIREFCNLHWAGIEEKNIKVIPRVYLYWPEKYYWPADLEAGDYRSSEFLERVGSLIANLGEAWDEDGRVAYVETGIVGPCGEQWGPTPHEELRRMIGDSYTGAFRHKRCMIRYPWQWLDYSFGVFWDSWGTHKDTGRMLEVLETPPLEGSWQTRVRGGEISYGFGEPPGDSPDDTMSKSQHIDWIECLVRRGHWNHLGWVSYYDWKRSIAAAHGQRLQKAFGHRFLLEEVRYPASVLPGQSLEISFIVRNTGSTPFYYNWPVTACLLNEQTHDCVWEQDFPGVDIRSWLPGDRWMRFASWNKELARFVLNERPARYEVAAQPATVSGRFTLPSDLAPGRYLLALAILDPAGRTPACRFAVMNYFAGGRHPIGRIGVGRSIEVAELDSTSFDDLAADRSLAYSVLRRS